MMIGFTVTFSSFLIAFVDWEELLNCDSEESCNNFESYIIKNPFATPSFHSFFSMLYILLFGIFWLWSLVSSIQILMQGMEMERFYREILRVDDVSEVNWNDVLRTLIRLHESRTHRVYVLIK